MASGLSLSGECSLPGSCAVLVAPPPMNRGQAGSCFSWNRIGYIC